MLQFGRGGHLRLLLLRLQVVLQIGAGSVEPADSRRVAAPGPETAPRDVGKMGEGIRAGVRAEAGQRVHGRDDRSADDTERLLQGRDDRKGAALSHARHHERIR